MSEMSNIIIEGGGLEDGRTATSCTALNKFLMPPDPRIWQVSVYRWDGECDPVASWRGNVSLPGPGSVKAFEAEVEDLRSIAGADRCVFASRIIPRLSLPPFGR